LQKVHQNVEWSLHQTGNPRVWDLNPGRHHQATFEPWLPENNIKTRSWKTWLSLYIFFWFQLKQWFYSSSDQFNSLSCFFYIGTIFPNNHILIMASNLQKGDSRWVGQVCGSIKITKIIRYEQPKLLFTLLQRTLLWNKEGVVLVNSLMDLKGIRPCKTDWRAWRNLLYLGWIRNWMTTKLELW